MTRTNMQSLHQPLDPVNHVTEIVKIAQPFNKHTETCTWRKTHHSYVITINMDTQIHLGKTEGETDRGKKQKEWVGEAGRQELVETERNFKITSETRTYTKKTHMQKMRSIDGADEETERRVNKMHCAALILFSPSGCCSSAMLFITVATVTQTCECGGDGK